MFRSSVAANGFTFEEDSAVLDIPLPTPPFPDTPQIRLLRSPADIDEEGSEQGNCVMSLLPEVLSGGTFLYRVLAPERATLSICRTNDKWQIKELLCAGNEPVSLATHEAVDYWLANVSRRETCVDNIQEEESSRHAIHEFGPRLH